MAEPEREESIPPQIREKFLQVWGSFGKLRNDHDLLAERVESQEKGLQQLTRIVKGDAEIGFTGVVVQMAQVSAQLATIQRNQEESERQRTAAKQQAEQDRKVQKARWTGVAVGLSLAAVPGVALVVEFIGKVIEALIA